MAGPLIASLPRSRSVSSERDRRVVVFCRTGLRNRRSHRRDLNTPAENIGFGMVMLRVFSVLGGTHVRWGQGQFGRTSEGLLGRLRWQRLRSMGVVLARVFGTGHCADVCRYDGVVVGRAGVR